MSQSPADGPERVPLVGRVLRRRDGGAPPPGPELAALLGEAVADARTSSMSGSCSGAGSAARRLRAHADYLEIMAVAEFARRREEQLEASKARGDRVRSRDGGVPGRGARLRDDRHRLQRRPAARHGAQHRHPAAVHPGGDGGGRDRPGPRPRHQQRHPPPARRPRRRGRQDPGRGRAGDAARGPADRRPPGSRPASTPRACRSARTRRRHDRRVELRREDSGAASLAGRELDPAEALAGKASIDAEAVRLRNAGLPGTLAQIRATILMDRIHQRSPWDRLAPPPEPQPEPDADDGDCGSCGDCDGTCGDSRDPAASPDAEPAPPVPADPDTEAGLPDDPHHDDPYDLDPCEDGQFPDAA